MRTSQASFAETELRQQVEIFGEGRISLDSLWHAAGEPAGSDVRSWVVLAEPILTGLGVYLVSLHGRRSIADDDSMVLWTWTAESCDPWLNGDLMSNAWVADLRQLPRRPEVKCRESGHVRPRFETDNGPAPFHERARGRRRFRLSRISRHTSGHPVPRGERARRPRPRLGLGTPPEGRTRGPLPDLHRPARRQREPARVGDLGGRAGGPTPDSRRPKGFAFLGHRSSDIDHDALPSAPRPGERRADVRGRSYPAGGVCGYHERFVRNATPPTEPTARPC